MPPSFADDTVTVIRRTVTGTDALGNDVYGETEIEVPGCRIQPVRSEEHQNNQQQTIGQWRLYGPPEMPVTSVDEIEFAGVRYEILGDPEFWKSPTGRLAHTEIILRKVVG